MNIPATAAVALSIRLLVGTIATSNTSCDVIGIPSDTPGLVSHYRDPMTRGRSARQHSRRDVGYGADRPRRAYLAKRSPIRVAREVRALTFEARAHSSSKRPRVCAKRLTGADAAVLGTPGQARAAWPCGRQKVITLPASVSGLWVGSRPRETHSSLCEGVCATACPETRRASRSTLRKRSQGTNQVGDAAKRALPLRPTRAGVCRTLSRRPRNRPLRNRRIRRRALLLRDREAGRSER